MDIDDGPRGITAHAVWKERRDRWVVRDMGRGLVVVGRYLVQRSGGYVDKCVCYSDYATWPAGSGECNGCEGGLS